MLAASLLSASLLLLQACNRADATPQLFHKSAGSLQCDPSRTTQANLDAEIAALRAAGATIERSGCSIDGLAHPALCGRPNGDLFTVEVAGRSIEIARRAGFRPAGDFPDAMAIPCRNGQ